MSDCLPELERWTWTLTWPWLCQLVVMVSLNFQNPWKHIHVPFHTLDWIPDPCSLFSDFTTQEAQHLCIITKRWQCRLLFIEVFLCVAHRDLFFSHSHQATCVIFLWPHSCFTLLWQFLLYSKASQPHVYVCVCVRARAHTRICLVVVWLFAAPRTVACQAPPSMEFSRQEYWSRLPFPPPEDLLDSGINLHLLHCRWILYGWATRETYTV